MTIETVTIEVDADTEEARRSFNALNSTASTFGRQITRALTDATVKGKDLDDVFRSLALSLSNSALTSGLKPLQDALSAGLGSLFSGLSGGGGAGGAGAGGGFLSSLGSILPFARGGVVSSPSFFPMNGRVGLAGEAGPEAIVPLQRGSDGRLGIASSGGGSAANITVNIATPDVQGFRQSEAQVTAALARALQRSRRTL